MILNIETSTNNKYNIHLNNNVASLYLYESAYANYIDNIISNEEALARSLKSAIPVTESSYSNLTAITEGSLSDNIKARCAKLVEFIKSLFAKFMESLTKILLDQKDYLKKYEDIIKKKRPKADMGDISYTGDYEKGIKRCIETTVPVFDYRKYEAGLKAAIADGDADNKDQKLVELIMQGREGFKYDAGESLEAQFKNYFICAEAGENKHKFADMNFTNMYNFCYNFKDIENNNKKDLNYLEKSTSAMVSYIESQQKSQGDNTNTNTQVSTTQQPTKQDNSNQSQTPDAPSEQQDKSNESNIINHLTSYTYIKEEESDSTPSGKTGMKFVNTNAPSQMSSYTSRDSLSDNEKHTAAIGSDGVNLSDLQKMADRWNNICRIIIGAKLNAVTQIAKDYMTIIREHVRSYVGKKDDSKDNRTAQQGDDYSQYRPKKGVKLKNRKKANSSN